MKAEIQTFSGKILDILNPDWRCITYDSDRQP